jgi:hypothetical protein
VVGLSILAANTASKISTGINNESPFCVTPFSSNRSEAFNK